MTFRSAMGWMCATRSRPDRTSLQFEPLEARELLAGDFRTFDGSGNNPDHSDWGAAETQLLRSTPPAYADAVAAPAGGQRPSPRVISNTIVAQEDSIPNEQYLTDMLWAWGQFLDHDITLTEVATPAEPFPIPVPQGDPYFDPEATGAATIPLDRSAYDPASGHSAGNPRQQLNAITAYIDASNVYGSDPSRAAALRTFSGGKMKTSPGDLLPYNVDHLPNAGGIADTLFVAGDVRANEQIGLTALHTLFVREHNRLADEIAWSDPGLTDEQIYQQARRLVGAQMQVITYQEFLPALLGAESLSAYQGYDPSVDAGIHNVFSTALFRFGHSMLSPQLLRLDNDGSAIDAGHIALRDAFFAPQEIAHYGIDPLLMGLSAQIAQEVDSHVVDDVRNFLFGDPGDGGFDLPALNIQRGRDHGLPDYNQVRAAYGLGHAGTFADITADTELQRKLKALYGDVNNVDPWVGAVAEEHLPGASVGQLIHTALVDQFGRLRDGDRYWYQHDLSDAQIAAVENTTLAEIIRRNTQITHLQENVFYDRSVIYHRGGGEAVDWSLKVVGDTVQVIDNLTQDVLHRRWVDDVSKIVLVGSPQDDHFYIDVGRGHKPFSGQIEIHGVEGYDELLWAGTAGDDYMLVVDSQVRLNDQTASYFGMEAVKVWAGDGDDVIGVQSHRSLFVTVLGAAGDDRIDGGDGHEVLLGGDGNDVVFAGGGDDYVEGGSGNDRLDGGRGRDQLYGQAGHDTLSGGLGDDLLFGGEGDDRFHEHAADDWMDGGGGADRLVLRDTSGDDLAVTYPGGGYMRGSGYRTNWQDVESVAIFGGRGGYDRAFLYDSAGDDRFVSWAHWDDAYLLGDGFRNRVKGFDRVDAVAVNGGTNDLAVFYDSAGNDRFVARAHVRDAYMVGTGFQNGAKGFDRVRAVASHGGANDQAIFHDSAGDDRFVARAHVRDAYMFGAGFHNYAKGFDRVHAVASHGGTNDQAIFHDSAGDDRFVARAHVRDAYMFGAGFHNYAKGFDRVHAVAANGGANDVAIFYDSAGDDRFVARAHVNDAYMQGDGFHNYAKGFDRVHAVAANGGANDVAIFYDSAGDDRFVARAHLNDAYLQGDGFHNYAKGFDRVHAVAANGGANDVAIFYDSAGDDRFVARAHLNDAYLQGDGFHNYARGFDRVHAVAANGGANDVAIFYDSAGDDTFWASATHSSMRGIGYVHVAQGFGNVVARATGGHDVAILSDVRTGDVVFGRGQWARAKRVSSQQLVIGFDVVKAIAAPGETPTSDVTAVDFVYRQIGDWYSA